MSQLNENNLANIHEIASLHFIETTRKGVIFLKNFLNLPIRLEDILQR